jgi:large subunit ribosomal protein L35
MPKQKTKRAARKRFKITATGKVKRFHAFKSHILTKKHPKRKRRLAKPAMLSSADQNRIKRLLEA